MSDAPLFRYLDFRPRLGAHARLDPTSAMIGRARAGPGLTLSAHATLRADGEHISVGAGVFFGARSTVHIADGLLGTEVGDGVSVGAYALVHACTVDERCVIGDAAVVMDGARIGPRAIVAAGALVPPRKQLAGGWLYAGSPAEPVREVGAGELAAAHAALREGRALDPVSVPGVRPAEPAAEGEAGAGPLGAFGGRAPRVTDAYVAPTARLLGDVALAPDAGVWFACRLRALGGRIVIGPRSNVQDNSIVETRTARDEVVLGADVTVGHNVRMGACVIEDASLVGMGSELGDGVVVERGGCVAARARLEPGTRVRAGWIWAGRPAREFRPLKPAEVEAFRRGAAVYVGYSRAYRGAG